MPHIRLVHPAYNSNVVITSEQVDRREPGAQEPESVRAAAVRVINAQPSCCVRSYRSLLQRSRLQQAFRYLPCIAASPFRIDDGR